MNKEMILREATDYEKSVLHLDLWYPRNETSEIKTIEIGLMDVRASDDIRVSFDFERDGWKIEQASTFEWDASDEVFDMDWQEVSFIPSWGRENTPSRSDG